MLVFIYVRGVFVADHCHLIPPCGSGGGAAVPRFTQQRGVISALTQHTAAGVLIQFTLLFIVKCRIFEWLFSAYFISFSLLL